MGASWRFFRFDDDGAIKRLSRHRFERIWNGSELCLEFAGRSIRIAQVLVDIESRRPRRIWRIDGLKLHFDGTGCLDEKKRQEWIRLEVQAADPSHGDTNNILGLAARRALSEYTFILERHEIAALSALIFAKTLFVVKEVGFEPSTTFGL